MTRIDLVVSEEMPIHELVKLLREKRVGGLPVVDRKHKIYGLVTVAEVFKAVETVRRMYHHVIDWFSIFETGKSTIKVKDVCREELPAVERETPVEQVFDMMLKMNLHTIPVMNKERTILYGVIGRHDVTWAMFGTSEQ